MNRARRKELQSLLDQIEEIKEALEILKEQEEGYRDNIPENLHGSALYEAANEAVDDLGFAVEGLESAVSYIEAAIGE